MKILLVDTNRAAVPLYYALKEHGHDVWVIGGDPTQPLAGLASQYIEQDYSNVDELAELVEEKGFDRLVPGCTDLSYEVCAALNRERDLGIDSLEVTNAINSKNKFRALARKLSLPVPQVYDLQTAPEFEYVIVKPVDSFSGRGMTVIEGNGRGNLPQAYAEACAQSPSGKAIIEEYVKGQLYSHSAFLSESSIVADFFVREDCVENPFTVDTSMVCQEFPNALQISIRGDIEKLAQHLNLRKGLIHTQFVVDGDRYWIMEATRRCPGDIYSLLIEYSTGYPYAQSYVAPFISKPLIPIKSITSRRQFIIRHTISSRDGEHLWGYKFEEPLNIKLFVPMMVAGEHLKPSPYSRAGIVFLKHDNAADQSRCYNKLLNKNLYSMTY